MRKTLTVRYILFSLLFALCIAGLCLRSYPLLGVLVVAAILLGVIGDKIENQPTEQFKKYNALHRLHDHGRKSGVDGGHSVAQ